MPLNLLPDCTFIGPALPDPFVRFELEKELGNAKLLAKNTGEEGRTLQESWEPYRRKLRELGVSGGAVRVRNHVLEPLVARLGYTRLEPAGLVATREGQEDGGYLMFSADGAAKLRVWAADLEEDLDAPARRGAAYRYSRTRIAQRVLLASGERLGLLTNGVELRLLISDPARPDSQVIIPIDPLWKRSRAVPDSYQLVRALAAPAGVKALPELVDKARLQQARVTKELRVQARQAIERFVQEVLDHPANREKLGHYTDHAELARNLWHEGLAIIYRLLFVLKLESSDDPARSFSFASTSLWRNTFSPSIALAQYARAVLDRGAETGRLLEDGLRALFRLFDEGLESTELRVTPLKGGLFDATVTPVLNELAWGERAVAHLLDQLLWTSIKRGAVARQRVHYGPLDVEDDADEAEEDEAPARGKKTKVEWIEAIKPGRFYLRVGLGRKATGSYYTPHSFVRFLVQETLGPQITERSSKEDPRPGEILRLKVLDPATGSGHFLVEAGRFLGAALYEACRLCDERALDAERRAEQTQDEAERAAALAEAREFRQRVIDLPDPDDELVRYLPSHAPEGQESGLSQRKAEALCRRMVAVHCLYGVDKNPLAVELAKLSLWLEAHAEGLPLTFLDHRIVVGDSLIGPFFEHLLTFPGSKQPVSDLFNQGLRARFEQALELALRHVADLQSSVGVTVADVTAKLAAKARLDRALAPFKIVAAAWAGGVMLGNKGCDDDAYTWLVQTLSETGDLPVSLADHLRLVPMIARGLAVKDVPAERDALITLLASGEANPALSYDLAFPEVFFPNGTLAERGGFEAVLGNPPWDAVRPKAKEFFAALDFDILAAPTKRERSQVEKRLKQDPQILFLHQQYEDVFDELQRLHDSLYKWQVVLVKGDKTGGNPDLAKLFLERSAQLLGSIGVTGLVVPSAFHTNEGATGVRRLYLEHLSLESCYCFENRRKLFEIDSRFKFAPIVAKRHGPTSNFATGFYLQDDNWLFSENQEDKPLSYSLDFVRRTGGEYLSLLELRSKQDLEIAEICFAKGEPFGKICDSLNIRLGRELHMTDDAWRFTPTSDIIPNGQDPRNSIVLSRMLDQGYLILHEGKTFWHYDDLWEARPSYCVSIDNLTDKLDWIHSSQFFRIAYRAVASSTNERTVAFHIIPAGAIFGNSAITEREPWSCLRYNTLKLVASTNSFTFDWTARIRAGANINQFILFSCPLPISLFYSEATRFPKQETPFLAHSALRLTCNHASYEPLWREQVGDVWREDIQPFTWPVLADDDARWRMRAAIDAVVADAYGLNREQYAHVLSTFSHKSYLNAPKLCLAAFDELREIGLDAFTQKYDPYWDIPLNESLPEPVIELPLLTDDRRRTTSDRPTQNVIDFGAAVAAREARRPVKKAAERREEYDIEQPVAENATLFGDEVLAPAPTGLTPLDQHVIFLARAIQKHAGTRFEKTLGHVKAEKLAHLAEGHLGVDFNRRPVKDAAGPVDFPHLKEVIARGRALGAFEDVRRQGDIEGYLFVPRPGLGKVAARLQEAFGETTARADKLINDLIGLNSHEIEAITTLYAVWNDLLRAGDRPTDDRIFEQFWAWHPSKSTFQLGELRTWIAWMRDANLVPTGQARPTGEKRSTGATTAGDPQELRSQVYEELSQAYSQLKALLAERGTITSGEAQTALGLDTAAVRPLLRRLVDEGLALVEGQKRGTRYRRR